MSATGGQPPYSWSLDSGKLPPGLTISTDGTVGGQPTTAGGYAFKVKVADSAGASQAKQVGVTIYKALSVAPYCDKKCIIGAGCSKCGGIAAATGGLPPYSYQVVGGAAPSGMGMSGLVLTGGFPAGSYNLTVQVTDQLGAVATVSGNWSIYNPAALNGGSDCTSAANPPMCSTSGWSYSGGNPGVAPKVSIVGYAQYCPVTGCYPMPTGAPPGWRVLVKNGVITMSAGGIPCNAVPSTYAGYVKLALVDTTSCPTKFQSNQVSLLVNVTNNC